VGVLANDSSNIVTLIEEEYGRIAEKIIMVSLKVKLLTLDSKIWSDALCKTINKMN
jgi:hypothetical protein